MKKKVMGIAIATVMVLSLGLMFATPVLAGNGPQDNNGQTWKATPPGEKDDSVHSQQIPAHHPYGQFWVDWKRKAGLIPGWEKNGPPDPHE